MKKCPFCAEEIQDEAIKCRYCGSALTSASVPSPTVVPAGPIPTAGISVDGPDARSANNASAVDERSATQVRKRSLVPILVTGFGFLMTFVQATVGFGTLVMWGGLAFALRGSRLKRYGGGFLLAVVLAVVGAALSGNPMTPRESSAPIVEAPTARSGSGPSVAAPSAAVPTPPPTPSFDLALLSAKGYEAEYGGYHYIEGQVKNLSDKPLQNVAAVGIWLDKDGEFIKSDDALIDYNPILPGQTSPFKTISSGNPAMSKYRVEFKRLFGGSLSVDDQRKR